MSLPLSKSFLFPFRFNSPPPQLRDAKLAITEGNGELVSINTLFLFRFTLLFLFPFLSLSAQTVTAFRTAELMEENYTISGEAAIKSYDDGSVKLTLSQDFTTPAGPDVRILLNNSNSLSGATELIDLSNISHFSDTLTVDVPAGVELGDNSRVIFFCVQFNQLWASGQFGDVTTVGGGFVCEESIIGDENAMINVSVCPTDGEPDLVYFNNSLGAMAPNYAYLLTDENDVLLQVTSGPSFDFEGFGEATHRVFGIHYDGELNPVIGANRLETTATGCFTHSAADHAITVTKDGCNQEYECQDQATATTNWVPLVDICPNDGLPDSLELRNSIFEPVGDHYAYLLTDTNETVLEVIVDSFYDFEGTGAATLRVYGVNFSGILDAPIGANRMQASATGCLIHSSAELYLTVTKNACSDYECVESLTATHAWVTSMDICGNDGTADEVFIQNNIDVDPGENYAFLLTDANEILREIILDSIYNFEGAGTEEMRIYGLSYSGELQAAIGENRTNTTATGCAIHSGDNLFLTIHPTAACASAVFSPEDVARVAVYPNPTSDLLKLEFPTDLNLTRASLFDALGRELLSTLISPHASSVQFDFTTLTPGLYTLRIASDERVLAKQIRVQR